MSVYEKDFEIEVIAGQDNYVSLKLPPRGFINRFNLRQVDGPIVGFNCDLFNSLRATPTGSESSSYADGVSNPAADPDLFKVIPTQTAANDVPSVELMDRGYSYSNRDGGPSRQQGLLYLRLQPGGSGVKFFQLSVAVALPQF